MMISIHTPTQGVTFFGTQSKQIVNDFNPHSHAGSDDIDAIATTIDDNFNPHSHAGSDFNLLILLNPALLFQSTLPRRE